MTPEPDSSADTPPNVASKLTTPLLLALLAYAGNYLFGRFFGFYDDDFIFTVPPYGWSWSEAWAHITGSLRYWPQGRPVGFAVTHLVSYLSAQTSTLGLGYLIGFGIQLLNALLLYRLARHILPHPAALLGAAVFVLYPADTSKAILMHRVFIQLNLTFLLTALLCYTRGWRWLAYPIAALCFLTYEPVFFVFLLAPLLDAPPWRIPWRQSLTHGLLCVGIVGVLLFVRSQVGDQRVAETFEDPFITVSRIAQALWIGPKTVLTALLARPFEALYATDLLIWSPVLLCAGAFLLVALYSRGKTTGPDSRRNYPLWVACVGLAGLLLGYAVCFRLDYWPPIMTIGRLSGYHAAGSVGAALLVGGFFGWALERFPRLHRWLVAAAALYCGLLVSFGIEVQRIDYVKHTEQQARFWRNILDTSGRWKPGTAILVDIAGNDPSRPFTPGMPLWWTVNFAPIILERLVEWPAEWAAASPQAEKRTIYPRVYGFLESFETAPDGDAVTVKTPPWLGPSAWPTIRDREFIYFRFKHNRMVRVTGPVTIGGREFQPMGELADPLPLLRTSKFHDTWFDRESQWQTIRDARNYPR